MLEGRTPVRPDPGMSLDNLREISDAVDSHARHCEFVGIYQLLPNSFLQNAR